MVDALFKNLGGQFLKRFVLVGVLPSALALLLWHISAFRLGRLAAILASWRQDGDASERWLLEAYASTFLILTVSSLAASSWLLEQLQRLPGTHLRALREYLVARKTLKLMRARDEAAHCEWRLSLLVGIANDVDPPIDGPPRVPDDLSFDPSTLSDARHAIEAWRPHQDYPAINHVLAKATRAVETLDLLLRKYTDPDVRRTSIEAEWVTWSRLLRGSGRPILDSATFLARHRWEEALLRIRKLGTAGRMEPTDLGNVVARLDGYAVSRYGIQTGELWNRLVAILTPDEKEQVGDAQLAMESFVASWFVLTLALAAELGMVLAARHPYPGRQDGVGGLFILATALLAFFAYRATVFAVDRLADRIVALIDLRRLDVLERLGYLRPRTVGEEREMFSELSGFFVDIGGARPDDRAIRPIAQKAQTGTPGGRPGRETAGPFRDRFSDEKREPGP